MALAGRPGLVGWEPHLVKMSAVPEASLSFNVIPTKTMVADPRNRKKNPKHPSAPTNDPGQQISIGEAGQSGTQHFPLSNDVTETQEKAVWFSGPRLAPLVKYPTPALTSGPDLKVVSSSSGLGHGRGMALT